MSDQQTFPGVTQSIWNCVQQTSTKEHGTVFDPPYPSSQGTATTHITAIGTVVLTFDFVSANDSVTYVIKSKPFIVTDGEIWDGIQSTINSCGSS